MSTDMSRAACLGRDPEIWFATNLDLQDEAVAICRTCPVRLECAQIAATHRTIYGTLPDGIWAGRVPPRKPHHDKRGKRICEDCGQLRVHAARGLCSTCYNRRHELRTPQGDTWVGWLELRDQGVGIEEAARRLGVTVSAIRKAIARHEARGKRGAA